MSLVDLWCAGKAAMVLHHRATAGQDEALFGTVNGPDAPAGFARTWTTSNVMFGRKPSEVIGTGHCFSVQWIDS